MKRCNYVIRNLPGGHTVRFSDSQMALDFAREQSKEVGTVEVSAPDGLIGQFLDGMATDEFSHLDRAD